MRIVLAVALVGILTVSANAQEKTSPVLDKLQADFVAAFNSKDATKLAALYAEDAVWMPPNQPLITGRPNIQRAFAKLFVGQPGTLKVVSIESAINGPSAFAAGTYTLTVARGTSVTLTGVGGAGSQTLAAKYLTVFKRVGADWKIAYDMQNTDQASNQQ